MSILVVIFLVYRRNRNGKDLDTHDRDIEYNKELNSTRVKIIDLKKMNPLPHTEINITL